MKSKICISVIICTHNPRKSYLERVLNALRHQTLDKNKWELILIDNASDESLCEKTQLFWHPNYKCVLETRLGLTNARLKGIHSAKGDTLVFVDDDNILRNDYLVQVLKIRSENPNVAVFSGNSHPEFEVKPSIPKRYLNILTLKTIEENFLISSYNSKKLPSGAGMVVKSDVALAYSKELKFNPERRKLDRKGKSLISSGDFDLAFTAIDMGMQIGLFKDLHLTHLIPKYRLEEDYVLELKRKIQYSNCKLRYIRFGTIPSKHKKDMRYFLKRIYQYIRLSKFERKYRLMGRKGTEDFQKEIGVL